jgi:hypothetical protein
MKKIKMFNKEIIIFLGFLYPIFCLSQTVDIKLSCQLSITKRYSTGAVERESVKEILEIYQRDTLLSIIPLSDSGVLGPVTTANLPNMISIRNESNQNKWHLNNIRTSQSGVATETTITIDRNSGSIFYFRNFESGRIVSDGQGQCQKIDPSKRLF